MATYTVRELADLIFVQPETIYRYLRERVLDRPKNRNKYSEAHLARAKQVRQLLEELRSFELVRDYLEGTPQEAPPPPPPPALENKAFSPWLRAELVPGLELHLARDATPLVQRLASEILQQFGSARAADLERNKPS
jgi:DNA-binding transcriptional MerR regulator